MKLKLHGNTIRLRLNRPEVARFAETGHLQEAFKYGPLRSQELIYGIETRDVDKVGLRVDEAGIIVVLPQAMANDWTGSERVGVYEEIVYPAGCRVSVLIEKEFRRMHGGTNDPDLYRNPLETA